MTVKDYLRKFIAVLGFVLFMWHCIFHVEVTPDTMAVITLGKMFMMATMIYDAYLGVKLVCKIEEKLERK